MDLHQVATFLAQGYKAEKVSRMLGISPSTLSETIKTPEFLEIFEPLKLAHVDTRRDAKYNELEEKVLKKLENEIEFAEIPNLVRVLDSISRYRQTKLPTPVGGLTNQGIINLTQRITLTLPEHAKHQLVINERGEIVAFGERSLTPLPTTAVLDVFKEIETSQESIFPNEITEPVNLKELLNANSNSKAVATSSSRAEAAV